MMHLFKKWYYLLKESLSKDKKLKKKHYEYRKKIDWWATRLRDATHLQCVCGYSVNAERPLLEFEVLGIILKNVAAITEEEVPAEERQRLFGDAHEVYAIELGEGKVVSQVSRAWCMYNTRHMFHL